jgi:2-phospho-L-lactate guanylyltransferase
MAQSTVADPTGAPARRRWTVVLPVKGGPAAKSRLTPPHVDHSPWRTARRAASGLAAAIAADTVAAVTACARVGCTVVVTTDDVARQDAEQAGAVVVPESRAGRGLSAAVTDGLSWVARRVQTDGPVVVLLADLPALRPQDLAAALEAAAAALAEGAPMVAVPDADQVGTVLLAAGSPDALDHAFGADSLAAHRHRGARILDLGLPRLRRDVDTPRDLLAALAMGCGARTTAVAADLARAGGYAGLVQATVHRFDPETGSGSVLTDQGTVLPFDAEAFATSGLRLLRIGQRLTVAVEGSGAAVRVTGMLLETVGVVPTERASP